MGSGASSATPCLAGFFALRCFSLITIWVTPESWAVKPITSQPHWFYTRILRVPKCFSPQASSLTPKSVHRLGGNRWETLLSPYTHRQNPNATTHTHNYHGKIFLNIRKAIKLVVVMSAVNVWKPP